MEATSVPDEEKDDCCLGKVKKVFGAGNILRRKKVEE